MRILRTARRPLVLITLLAAISVATASTQGRRFYDDDPIARDTDTEDASGAQPWDMGLFYDLTFNLFVTAGTPAVEHPRGNVNTIDEVPDSSWFTNRVVSARAARRELVRGPNVGPAAGAGEVGHHPREGGRISRRVSRPVTPRARRGSCRSIRPSNPKGATAAVVIANRLFWALGYNQVETFITSIDPARLEIDPTGDDPPAVGRQNAVHQGRPRCRARARGPELRRHL